MLTKAAVSHVRSMAPMPGMRRFILFVAVGLVSSAGYVATLSLCIEWFGLGVISAAFLAFCVGTAISYVGNSLITFRARFTAQTFWRFLLVVVLGMVANQAIAWTLNQVGAHYLFIALAVFIVVPVVNFVGHSLFTYRGTAA